MISAQVMTAVTLSVPPGREDELVAGYRELLSEGPRLDGLLRSELLRSSGGQWVIQTLWRSREAILAARESGARPLALTLAERVGAEHSHDLLTLEAALG